MKIIPRLWHKAVVTTPSSFINALNLFAFLSVLLLKNTAKSGTERLTKICLSADACGELKAYEYHTGVVFCAYNEDYSKALAQGGRYNGLSASFGRPRAATGFSFDLKFLTH
jgi:ATP phosphoribosyltransferase regulatory subunit HisZ